MSVYLIGEIASAHDNDWSKVERLVTLCAQSGFSACKLQYWSNADRLADRRHATPEYRAIYHKYAIPEVWLPDFQMLCHTHDLEAVVTVYLPEDVEIVARYADRVKIASFENEDHALISQAVATTTPVIVSMGMRSEDDDSEYRFFSGAKYLYCVSAYPARVEGALSMLCYFDGYSDHTHNIWTGAVAVGCGADIIEVHVRLGDTNPANPDYAAALDPAEFARYAEGVRTAERLIADVPVDESAMRKFKVKPA